MIKKGQMVGARTFVALLRGINVGGNKKVEMKKLKEVFEKLGFENVSTYINSGNVIFESDRVADQVMLNSIEKALLKTFGFEIKTLVRSKENIQKICAQTSSEWINGDGQKTDVLFLWDEFDKKDSLELLAGKPGIDNLKYIDGAIVWNIDRSKYAKSAMNKFIGTLIYKNMTARNINTVRKLAELMG